MFGDQIILVNLYHKGHVYVGLASILRKEGQIALPFFASLITGNGIFTARYCPVIVFGNLRFFSTQPFDRFSIRSVYEPRSGSSTHRRYSITSSLFSTGSRTAFVCIW